jgi:hypothetical protein
MSIMYAMDLLGVPAYRQENHEFRAFPFLAFHLDPSFVLLDDAVDDRQTQPGSLSDRLGGEKWFEQMRQYVLIHPASGIGYRYAGNVPHVSGRRRGRTLAGKDNTSGSHGDPPAVRHGIARVDQKIHYHLLNPTAVGINPP